MAVKLLLIISLTLFFGSPGKPMLHEVPPIKSSHAEHFKSHPEYRGVVRKLFPHLKKERLESFVYKFSSFHDRYPGTVKNEAEEWLLQEIRSALRDYKVGLTSTNQIAFNKFFKYTQVNHIVELVGHDPELKSQLIILGAHYDTGQPIGGREQPGADDNATGCAVLFEVLRLLAQFGIKLKRSLEFHFYSGGEGVNILGSETVKQQYRRTELLQNIKGMLNVDRIGYKGDHAQKSIGVVDNFGYNEKYNRTTNPALTSFVKMLIKEYTDVETKEEMKCNLRCISDNFSWHKAGVPAAFVTEFHENPRFNEYTDSGWDVNLEQVQEFAKLAVAFVIELGELAEIPNVPDVPTTEPTPEKRKRRSRSFAVKPEVGWRSIGILLLGGVNFLQ